MNFLAQIILAARNNDGAGWMKILFIVVMAILWLVGGITKARANKPKDSDFPEEQPGRKPGFKPQEGTRTPHRQPRPRPQPPRREVMRPRPAIQKLAPKTEPFVQLPTLEPLEVSELSLSVPIEEPREFISEPIEPLKPEYTGISTETAQPKAVIEEPLLDFDDPDELRRAILHYEILGKPLSLRVPGGKIIGL